MAVLAAKRCLFSDSWGYASTGKQRAIILRKIGEIIAERSDELARLDSLDHGKVLFFLLFIFKFHPFNQPLPSFITYISLTHINQPLREAQADMGDAVTACNHFADLAEKQDLSQDEVYKYFQFNKNSL